MLPEPKEDARFDDKFAEPKLRFPEFDESPELLSIELTAWAHPGSCCRIRGELPVGVEHVNWIQLTNRQIV